MSRQLSLTLDDETARKLEREHDARISERADRMETYGRPDLATEMEAELADDSSLGDKVARLLAMELGDDSITVQQ